MYNEANKEEFIKNYTNVIQTAETAKSVFNRTQPYEEKHGADLCTMSTEELQPIVDNVLALRSNSKWVGMPILREYFKWCALIKYPGVTDGIFGVNIIGIEKLRKQMVASPLHLQQFLDEVFDKEDEETIDVTYRCYLWMAYGGMSEWDAHSVKESDVDLVDRLVRYGDGLEAQIYNEAVKAFKKAVSLTEFVYKNDNYVNVEEVRRDRVSGNKIMRGFRGTANVYTVRQQISRKTKDAEDVNKTTQNLSYKRVWLSGLFYRISEVERTGLRPDFSHIVDYDFKDKDLTSSTEAQVRQMWVRKNREYMSDYLRWKLAFSI